MRARRNRNASVGPGWGADDCGLTGNVRAVTPARRSGTTT